MSTLTSSVVITVYNLERYVGETIESVLAQRRPATEVLVVDDASTDRSADVLARFGDRIRVLRNERNLGVLGATVRGIEAASGDVICFLDGDDLWEADKLAAVLPRFEADPGLVFCSHDRSMIDGEGNWVQSTDTAQAPNRTASARSARMRRSVLEYRGEVWLGSAWCIRRDALDRTALDSWMRSLPHPELVYQDHPLATLLLLTNPSGRLDWIDEPLLRYRVHDANYSSAARDLERARHIVDKGWATRKATHELVARYSHDPALEERQAVALEEYAYLRALYWNDLPAGLRAFASCARALWTPRQLVKEAARLVAVGLLGPERFFALRERR